MSNGVERPTNWLEVESYRDTFKRRANKRILSAVEHVQTTQYNSKQRLRDDTMLHPSQLAKNNWCPRANYFELARVPESNSRTLTFRQYNIFRTGDDIHSKWQHWMWEAGSLEGNWVCDECEYAWMGKSPTHCPNCGVDSSAIRYREVPIYSDKHHIIGHSDAIWSDDLGRAVVEIKSVGPGTIRWEAPALYKGYEDGEIDLDGLWDHIKRPLLPHRKQVNLYMYFLGITDGIVIYEWKPTSDAREFHVRLEMDLVQPMLDGADQVIEALVERKPPPKPEGFRKTKECLFCPFKTFCWDNLDTDPPQE